MIKIIVTGGTFNKFYNSIKGDLEVKKGVGFVQEIIKKSFKTNIRFSTKGIIFKDSVFFTDKDRERLSEEIKNATTSKIIVIHGTDTIKESALFVEKKKLNKCIVFCGSMMPYSIDPTEAVSNFTLAFAKVFYCWESGVFIAMNGLIEPICGIKKDRGRGYFVKS
jgi:L-asparaginase